MKGTIDVALKKLKSKEQMNEFEREASMLLYEISFQLKIKD